MRNHSLIQRLLKRRDEKLESMHVGQRITGPTGIEIRVEERLDEDGDGVDPKSALATLAQSYEQELMSVILELEQDRQQQESYNRFRVMLWLHDGAYVHMPNPNARMRQLQKRLDNRSRELADFTGKDTPLPAFFELEEVTPPEEYSA